MSDRSDPQPVAITIRDGVLVLSDEEGIRHYDFNQVYQGYYPEMELTAAAVCHGQYAVCGTDAGGMPHLYLSTDGNAWTPRTLLPAVIPEGLGRIVEILALPVGEELLAVAKDGTVLNLPDCPHCVRAVRLTEGRVTGAALEDEQVVLFTPQGEQRFPLMGIIRHRINWAFALENRYLILDLRGPGAEPPVPGALPVPAEQVAASVESYPTEMRLAFVAQEAETADQMADLFISRGRNQTRSLGSFYDLLFSE